MCSDLFLSILVAPEIIEMSNCGTSSDIWSIGCTIIELLTGTPPYFDLGTMSALFNIVQDAHPPLPEGISEVSFVDVSTCYAY